MYIILGPIRRQKLHRMLNSNSKFNIKKYYQEVGEKGKRLLSIRMSPKGHRSSKRKKQLLPLMQRDLIRPWGEVGVVCQATGKQSRAGLAEKLDASRGHGIMGEKI